MISGASGGIESAVVQLAKARGAKIIAITNPSKFDEIKSLGASQVISRDENIVDAQKEFLEKRHIGKIVLSI